MKDLTESLPSPVPGPGNGLDRANSNVEVRISRASAVIVQRVAPATVDWFLAWQNGVATLAKTFSGYQGTDIYPPTAGQGDDWVAVVHFVDSDALQRWLSSPARAASVAQLRAQIGEFDLRTGGFGFWFTDQSPGSRSMPPSWKMVIAVLCGLYPTTMLLSFIGPYFAWMGFAPSMLVSLALSVSILQWIVMPRVTTALSPWLNANGPSDRTRSTGGLCLLLLLLVGMVLMFRLVTG